MLIGENFSVLRNVLPLSWSEVIKMKHISPMVLIKPNRKSFILPLKNYSRHRSEQRMRREAFNFFLPSLNYWSLPQYKSVQRKRFFDPIDCPYEGFRQYAETEEDFIPTDLESKDHKKRTKAAEIVRTFFKDAAEVSNSTITKNANNLLTTLRHDDNDITWIGTTKQRGDAGRFKLSY